MTKKPFTLAEIGLIVVPLGVLALILAMAVWAINRMAV